MKNDIFESDPNVIVTENNGRPVAYILMNEPSELNERLQKYGCRTVTQNDWKFDTALPQHVRDYMEKKCVRYALTPNSPNGFAYRHEVGKGSFSAPLKYLRPIPNEKVSVTINGKKYQYFMTNDFSALKEKLWTLHCLPPKQTDWRQNLVLNKNVIDKMTELGATYSLTTSHNVAILNYYYANGTPFVINLKELHKKQQAELRIGALGGAIRRDEVASVQIFIKTKADTQKFVYDSFTPLMVAASFNALKTAEMLLSLGADVNSVTNGGVTALMLASANGFSDFVQLLLKNDADIHAQAKNGWTAQVYALANNHSDIANLLSEKNPPAETETTENSPPPEAIHSTFAPFPEKFRFFLARFVSMGENKPCEIYQNLMDCISKQSFSKLQDKVKHPKKQTVILLAIGMKLSISDTDDFLASAGYAFSPSSKSDRIFREFIQNGNYNIFDINNKIWKETGGNLFEKKRKKK